MENPTVGYALGMVEGFLESMLEQGHVGAQVVLEHLKIIENAYIEKNSKVLEYEAKLKEIRTNLDGGYHV